MMESRRKVHKVFSQRDAMGHVVFATFARTFASFAFESALAPLIMLPHRILSSFSNRQMALFLLISCKPD